VQPNIDDDMMGGGAGAADPRAIFGRASNATADDAAQVRRTITMYRDGFIVDDGPYRRLDDPANRPFLEDLARGITPKELVDEASQESKGVVVGLVDKRNEEYVPEFQSFSGHGTSLGTRQAGGVVFDPAALSEPNFSNANNLTSIQARLGNQRRVLRVPLSATIEQVASLLRSDVDGPFRLVAGFPPKPLEDAAQTVEDAGLKGAQVQVQKAE
jgi:UBX domain-containing protein 1